MRYRITYEHRAGEEIAKEIGKDNNLIIHRLIGWRTGMGLESHLFARSAACAAARERALDGIIQNGCKIQTKNLRSG